MRFLLATSVLLAAALLFGANILAVDTGPHLYLWQSDTTPGASGRYTDFELYLPYEGPALAALTIYVPRGYKLNPRASSGSTIYDGRAWFTGVALPPAAAAEALTFRGEVVSDDPAKYTNDPDAQACAPGTHAGVWLAVLPEAGYPATVTFTFFVDPTTGADADLGAYKIKACFPPPAQLQAHYEGLLVPLRLIDIELSFSPTVFYNPSAPGSYQWRAFLTSYAPGTVTAETAGTVEVRADVAIPQVITARGTFDPKTETATITGRVLSLDKPRAGLEVRFYANVISDWGNAKIFGVTQTRADGTYVFKKRITRTLWIRPWVDQSYGACTDGASTAPGGCVDESIAGPPPPLALHLVFKKAVKPKRR